MHFNDRKTFKIVKYSHIFAIHWSLMIGPPTDNSDPIKAGQTQADHGPN